MCVYRIKDAQGMFGEHERSVRVARGVANSKSSFLSESIETEYARWLIGLALSSKQTTTHSIARRTDAIFVRFSGEHDLNPGLASHFALVFALAKKNEKKINASSAG